MTLLYYWRSDNYRCDLDLGAGYHLNQASPLLHTIDIGDSLWAFTRNSDGAYVLAAELVVRAKTYNSPKFRYGKYRVWGDLKKSRYFKTEGQPSVEQIIRSLSCKVTARILGQSFQGYAAVKQCSYQDHQILSVASKSLPLEPRARLLPEERLEAALLLGDEEAVQVLIQEEAVGVAKARQEYLFRQAPSRNKKFVRELQKMYQGKCQICLWNPEKIYGGYICHGHHLQWLSRGGEDTKENMVLICPSHHAAIHHADAPFNYLDFMFDFGSHKEPLQLNHHLA